MRLVDAMTARDGGTTCITLSERHFRKKSYTIDYSLPRDGRTRYLFRGLPFEKKDQSKIEINSSEEREIVASIKALAERKSGANIINAFLAGGIKPPINGKWFYALTFIRIIHSERQEHKSTG